MTQTLLAFVTIFLAAAQVIFASNQAPLSCEGSRLCAPSTTASSLAIITDEFRATVQGILNETGVRGLSLGIIKKDGSSEFGGWGIMTEDGKPVDANVGAIK